MLFSSEFPILEFDTDRDAKIRADRLKRGALPEKCVLTFFREVLENLAREKHLNILGYQHSEILDIPIYEYKTEQETVCLTMPFMTSPGAAGTIEELRAMGCNKFLICGGAGCLQPDIAVGKLILPISAIRDEGTSYHYLKPAREVRCNAESLQRIREGLQELQIPYIEGKTWTTDAYYRETEAKIQKRAAEGCITVEMEAAAFFAVAEFYGISLAQILYAGDDLTGAEWDSRDWNRQKGTRENLVLLTLKLIGKL